MGEFMVGVGGLGMFAMGVLIFNAHWYLVLAMGGFWVVKDLGKVVRDEVRRFEKTHSEVS